MARFNSPAAVRNLPDTINEAGGQAHQESSELELVSILLTSMVQDQFYRSGNQTIDRLETLIDALVKNGQAYFAAQAGVYARRVFGLRSITHLLAASLARKVRGADWTKDFYNVIVRRPDDMLEIMALVLKSGKNVPNALKDGFARALLRLDAYALAKYKGEGKDVKMVDVVNLCHPIDQLSIIVDNQSALNKLMTGTLPAADTWEVGLSSAGKKTEDAGETVAWKQSVWTDLLRRNKLGYLALLRNIRNIAATIVDPATLDLAVIRLTDRDSIKNSLVFPFQIHTAYDVICSANLPIDTQRMFVRALRHAGDIAMANVPRFDGPTLIAMDLSGSMTAAVGTSTAAKVGGLFAAVLWKANEDSELMIFGSRSRYLPLQAYDMRLFNLASTLAVCNEGGTNFHNIFRTANKKYRRIIIISDCQAWEEHETPRVALAEYSTKFNCSPHIYSLDLCGLGTLQFPENKVYAMAGFSDKIFDVMKMLESDRMALVNKIKEINIHTEAMKLMRKK